LALGHTIGAAFRRWRRGRPEAGETTWHWLPLLGFVASYVPCMSISRPLFLYHSLPSLVFAIAVVVLWLDRAGWLRPEGLRAQRRTYYLALAALVAGFVLVSPFTFGYRASVPHEALLAILIAR
jgi:dolichyl-phosphate-mannose--protein O-mannosyl transferase